MQTYRVILSTTGRDRLSRHKSDWRQRLFSSFCWCSRLFCVSALSFSHHTLIAVMFVFLICASWELKVTLACFNFIIRFCLFWSALLFAVSGLVLNFLFFHIYKVFVIGMGISSKMQNSYSNLRWDKIHMNYWIFLFIFFFYYLNMRQSQLILICYTFSLIGFSTHLNVVFSACFQIKKAWIRHYHMTMRWQGNIWGDSLLYWKVESLHR